MSDPESPERSGDEPLPPTPPGPADEPLPPTETRPLPPLPPAAQPEPYTQPLPTSAEPARPRGIQRLLLIVAAGLGSFVLLCGIAIALLLAFNPGLRARLLSGADMPPEGPDKFAGATVGRVRIEDGFDTPTSRWDRSQTRIVDGTYEESLELDNFDSYGLFLGAAGIRDFDIAVDVTQVAGPKIAEYGIRFRQSAPDEHLLFSISGNGYYRLAQVSNEKYSSLVPWQRSRLINTTQGAVNRLRVVAEGETIRGFINGEQVLEYRDTSQQSGQLTLGLVTFDQGGLVVRFDNIAGFAVQPPTGDTPGAQPTKVDLKEEFSDPATAAWTIGGATLKDGAYEVFVGGPVQTWQQPLPTGSSEVQGNFTLEVEATLLSGNASSSGYGLMFGDSGTFDFFALYLLPEGGLMLLRSGTDGGTIIQPTAVPTVHPGVNATNKIKIEARANVLTVTINDQSPTDLEFPEGVSFAGRVGLIVLSQDPDGVRARFDNFLLEEQ